MSMQDAWYNVDDTRTTYRRYTENHVQSLITNQNKDLLYDLGDLRLYADPEMREQLRAKLRDRQQIFTLWHSYFDAMARTVEELLVTFELFDTHLTEQQWAEDLEPMDE